METFFIITVNEDGSLTSQADWPAEPLVANRQATTYDIYQAAKQIAEEFEAQIMADRIADTVLRKMAPPVVNNTANIISEALKERGIKPESVTPAQ